VKRILLGVSVSAASLAFVMTTLPGAVVTASDVLSIPLDNCVRCKDNQWCPEETHDAWDTDPLIEWYARAGGAHLGEQCMAGDCDRRHGPCTLPEDHNESQELFRQAILSNDHQRIAELLTLYQNESVLNAERGAIQVYGCRKTIIAAHFPVGPELMDALVDRTK
jgi:hypothetical protein